MHYSIHRGWSIDYDAARPVTGTWRAARYGVGMCAGDRDALVRMIDQKNADSTQRDALAPRDSSAYTRAAMMAEPYTNKAAAAARHRRYYAQFVSPRVVALVVQCIGSDAIMASRDPHFNDIPLARWDALAPMMKDLCLSRMGDVNGAVSIGEYGQRSIAWSLSDAVCIAKEAARQHAESLGSRVWGSSNGTR